MRLRVVAFSDFICPFCYIGLTTTRKLARELDFELECIGYEIHPDWPAAGISAKDFYASQGLNEGQWRSAWERIARLAGDAGLAIKPRERMSSSRLALQAAELARERGVEQPFEKRVFSAYFEQGADIGDVGVLAALGEEVGVETGELRSALSAEKYRDKLMSNADLAHQYGVTGVPTFFVRGFPIVGAQSEQTMREILKRVQDRVASA